VPAGEDPCRAGGDAADQDVSAFYPQSQDPPCCVGLAPFDANGVSLEVHVLGAQLHNLLRTHPVQQDQLGDVVQIRSFGRVREVGGLLRRRENVDADCIGV